MGDDSAQLPGPCQRRRGRGLTWVCPRSPADLAPPSRRRLGGDIALPDQDGPTHARKRGQPRGWPRFHAPHRSWRSAGTIFGRAPGPRRPGRRGRVGRRTDVGVGASGPRRHRAAHSCIGCTNAARACVECTIRPGRAPLADPGRAREVRSAGTWSSSFIRWTNLDAWSASHVPASSRSCIRCRRRQGRVGARCRDDAVQQPGPCQRRSSPSSQRIFTRSWKPSPPS